MMAPTLLGLPAPHEQSHRFEYFVCASEMLIEKVVVMDLQKPVVSFILFETPVSEFSITVRIFKTFLFSRL